MLAASFVLFGLGVLSDVRSPLAETGSKTTTDSVSFSLLEAFLVNSVDLKEKKK